MMRMVLVAWSILVVIRIVNGRPLACSIAEETIGSMMCCNTTDKGSSLDCRILIPKSSFESIKTWPLETVNYANEILRNFYSRKPRLKTELSSEFVGKDENRRKQIQDETYNLDSILNGTQSCCCEEIKNISILHEGLSLHKVKHEIHQDLPFSAQVAMEGFCKSRYCFQKGKKYFCEQVISYIPMYVEDEEYKDYLRETDVAINKGCSCRDDSSLLGEYNKNTKAPDFGNDFTRLAKYNLKNSTSLFQEFKNSESNISKAIKLIGVVIKNLQATYEVAVRTFRRRDESDVQIKKFENYLDRFHEEASLIVMATKMLMINESVKGRLYQVGTNTLNLSNVESLKSGTETREEVLENQKYKSYEFSSNEMKEKRYDKSLYEHSYKNENSSIPWNHDLNLSSEVKEQKQNFESEIKDVTHSYFTGKAHDYLGYNFSTLASSLHKNTSNSKILWLQEDENSWDFYEKDEINKERDDSNLIGINTSTENTNFLKLYTTELSDPEGFSRNISKINVSMAIPITRENTELLFKLNILNDSFIPEGKSNATPKEENLENTLSLHDITQEYERRESLEVIQTDDIPNIEMSSNYDTEHARSTGILALGSSLSSETEDSQSSSLTFTESNEEIFKIIPGNLTLTATRTNSKRDMTSGANYMYVDAEETKNKTTSAADSEVNPEYDVLVVDATEYTTELSNTSPMLDEDAYFTSNSIIIDTSKTSETKMSKTRESIDLENESRTESRFYGSSNDEVTTYSSGYSQSTEEMFISSGKTENSKNSNLLVLEQNDGKEYGFVTSSELGMKIKFSNPGSFYSTREGDYVSTEIGDLITMIFDNKSYVEPLRGNELKTATQGYLKTGIKSLGTSDTLDLSFKEIEEKPGGEPNPFTNSAGSGYSYSFVSPEKKLSNASKQTETESSKTEFSEELSENCSRCYNRHSHYISSNESVKEEASIQNVWKSFPHTDTFKFMTLILSYVQKRSDVEYLLNKTEKIMAYERDILNRRLSLRNCELAKSEKNNIKYSNIEMLKNPWVKSTFSEISKVIIRRANVPIGCPEVTIFEELFLNLTHYNGINPLTLFIAENLYKQGIVNCESFRDGHLALFIGVMQNITQDMSRETNKLLKALEEFFESSRVSTLLEVIPLYFYKDKLNDLIHKEGLHFGEKLKHLKLRLAKYSEDNKVCYERTNEINTNVESSTDEKESYNFSVINATTTKNSILNEATIGMTEKSKDKFDADILNSIYYTSEANFKNSDIYESKINENITTAYNYEDERTYVSKGLKRRLSGKTSAITLNSDTHFTEEMVPSDENERTLREALIVSNESTLKSEKSPYKMPTSNFYGKLERKLPTVDGNYEESTVADFLTGVTPNASFDSTSETELNHYDYSTISQIQNTNISTINSSFRVITNEVTSRFKENSTLIYESEYKENFNVNGSSFIDNSTTFTQTEQDSKRPDEEERIKPDLLPDQYFPININLNVLKFIENRKLYNSQIK